MVESYKRKHHVQCRMIYFLDGHPHSSMLAKTVSLMYLRQIMRSSHVQFSQVVTGGRFSCGSRDLVSNIYNSSMREVTWNVYVNTGSALVEYCSMWPRIRCKVNADDLGRYQVRTQAHQNSYSLLRITEEKGNRQ